MGSGQLVVLGSFHVFDDSYLTRQHNSLLLAGLMDVLVHSNGRFLADRLDADRPEYSDPTPLPDTAALAERLRSCLQEPEEVPLDFTTLFDTSLFKFDTALIPEANRTVRRPARQAPAAVAHPAAVRGAAAAVPAGHISPGDAGSTAAAAGAV